jgi:hypothetical protein
MVHELSSSHFTHITIRYSTLSSFPCSSCQTIRGDRICLSSPPFRLLREPHQWLRCPAIIAQLFRLSTPKFEILDCGIRTPKALYGGHTPTRHHQH